MVIEMIDWKRHREQVADARKKSEAEWAERMAQVRITEQGRSAADTELVRFIVANYPVTLLRGMSETKQDEVVDQIATNHGFTFYRTASVRKQVAYRFKHGQVK